MDVRIDMRIDGGNRIGWLLAAAIGSLLAVCFIVRYPQTVQSSAVTFEIIISEVAWSGTDASSTDEWLELHNNSAQPVSLEGWSLVIDGVEISLAGSVAPNGYFLLERNDDQTVSDIPADQIYTGILANTGVSITLVNATGALIDSANVDEGPWPGGTASPDFRSMERIHPYAPDLDSNWISNDAITINGIDAFGNPINGTPGKANSSWADLPPEADLTISKSGPATVYAGTLVPYEITLNNTGQISADNVLLTDTLPTGFGYVNDNSGLPISQTSTNTLVWQIGIMSVDDPRTFILTASVPSDAAGIYINHVAASSTTTETITYNNMDDASTNVITPSTPLVLIDAVYYDGYETNEPDEAVRIINVGDSSADLEGWSLTDGAASSAFPENVFLEPGEAIWISRGGEDFYRQFGFRPDFESQDTSSEIADMEGAWPGFSNAGDEVILLNRFGQIQDAVVYENGDATHPGWSGPAVQPYLVPGIFGAEGQILFRKRSPDTYLPIADTNAAEDWAQDYSDVESGRRVQYPGWDIDKHLRPLYLTETTTVEIAIAPDNSYEFLKREILGAQESVRIASYTFRSFALTIDLVEALSRGVSVTVLLEGGPAGGIDEQEKYNCMLLEEAGGQCWFMINDPNHNIFDRYHYYHAKYMIIDDQFVILSTENLSPESFPDDDKVDGTWGRRGLLLKTPAGGVVQYFSELWNYDFDPENHLDLMRWSMDHPVYGAPIPGTVPMTSTVGSGYTVRYQHPVTFTGSFHFEMIQSPANSLASDYGLLGLINRAGDGDEIYAQELYELTYWGDSGSNPISDPNPRLESMIEAARRGTSVHLLLDGFFDDPEASRSNWGTCKYVQAAAQEERLDIYCVLGNPSGLGIHNKMILFELDGVGYVHMGSLNGSEVSSKGNREIAIQIESDSAFEYLRRMYFGDWPGIGRFPIIFGDYQGRADYVLISEVLYDSSGPDLAEFIEIANPTNSPIDISSYSIGDALSRDDYEDVRRFPSNTILTGGDALVVANTATGFYSLFGYFPDFEIRDSHPLVSNLIDDPTWGAPGAYVQLSNQGDEVILRNADDEIVDAIGYGSGYVPGVISCPLVQISNYSLERYPFWMDTNDCGKDFRSQSDPTPGTLP